MLSILPVAAKIGIGEAGITAIFGYIVVFAGLLCLMTVLYIMAAFFKAKSKKAESKISAAVEIEKTGEPHMPLAPGSAGHVKLYDVPDKEAAMIMSIVAYKMQMPLNELHFISIKEVKENEV